VSQRKLQRVNGKMPGARASPGELAERHLHLVHHIARDFQKRLPRAVSFDDLVGAGNLGLLEAARRFDPSRGASFGAFARHRIRGAITDSLREIDSISRCRRSQWRAAERAIAVLSTRLGRAPTDREIAVRLKLSEGRWQKLCQELYESGCPVDGHRWPTAAPASADCVPGTWPDPERLAARAELRAAVTDAIRTLPPRYREVVTRYHFAGWTMKQIGTQLGVNESRVSQIHSGALRRLRQNTGLRDRA
jgi:RNA polymerase sigma factor for flagellar operon FliA